MIMCSIDNRTPCYHAAEPLAVDDMVPGTEVSVPWWEEGRVIDWRPATVWHRMAQGGDVSVIVQHADGERRLQYAYSVGRPGTAGRS